MHTGLHTYMYMYKTQLALLYVSVVNCLITLARGKDQSFHEHFLVLSFGCGFLEGVWATEEAHRDDPLLLAYPQKTV